MPNIWDRIKGFWTDHVDVENKSPVWFVPLAPEQIADQDLRAVAGIELQPGVHYVQFAVRSMNLRTDEFLGKKKFPVVHSQIILDAGGGKLTFPALAGHDKVGELDVAAGGRSANNSYPLMPLQPYHDGNLELVAGVVAMNGEDAVTRLTNVVSRVTNDLVPAALGIGAAVQTGINVTTTALDCVDELFGHADATVVLGTHALFAPHLGDRLRTGLYALVNTEEVNGHAPADSANLVYVDDELKYRRKDGTLANLRARDWMVVEVGATTRRSYRTFPQVDDLMDKAVQEMDSDPQKAVTLRNAAITAIFVSNDVVRADRKRIYDEIREDFDVQLETKGIKLETVTKPIPSDGWDGGRLAGATERLTDLIVTIP